MELKYLNFAEHGDNRGQLVALETQKEVPFAIKRVYYIFDTKEGVRRGKHAHKLLKQVLICVSGSCKLLLDDGTEKRDVVLNSPAKGILVEHNIWREMYDFSDDAVLLVLASEYYDESDYIRNYEAFLKYVGGQDK